MSTNMETAIEFANKVRNELRHLTSEQIADLTDGLEADIASSLDDGADIGSAEKYARDLLAAAGLSVAPTKKNIVSPWLRKFQTAVRFVRSNTADLAPAWWVFRAWVLAQLIGFFLFHDRASSPGYMQWGNMQWAGVLVFAALAYFSIRMGRREKTLPKRVILMLHVILAIAGIAFLFVPSDMSNNWSTTSRIRPGFSYCLKTSPPDIAGLKVVDAKVILEKMNFAYEFFDQDAMVAIADAPDQAKVLQVETLTNNDPCTPYQLRLVVDLVQSAIDSSIGAQTTTTLTPPASGLMTTTIPYTTTTTVKPKATTTTKP